jgi:hypothetical protein
MMSTWQRLASALRDARWLRRAAMVVLAGLAALWAVFFVRTEVIPFGLRAYSCAVRLTLAYAFVTLFVSVLSQSTAKKMLHLYWVVVERLLLDPLLYLLGQREKKHRDDG